MNPNALALLVTLILGYIVFVALIPHDNRQAHARLVIPFGRLIRRQLRLFRDLAEAGGYVHDTAMCQWIPPTAGHYVTGTWTMAAGQTAGTIVMIKAAAAETSTINIPIPIPSNSVSGKGSYLKYVEVDYEIRTAAATSITLSIAKVVAGADGADATVTAPAGTQTLTPATTAATVNEHLDKFTLTTPAWIDDGEYYMLKIAAVCAATTVLEILGARAYYTARL